VLTTGRRVHHAEGLNYEQSFPALLDSALAQCLAPRPVQVINAGVTGYGPREEEPQFDELGAMFPPRYRRTRVLRETIGRTSWWVPRSAARASA